MYDRPLVFLDLETTGATATHDRITEVGIVEVENGRFVREWSSLVNPGISIPPAIQSLTGISNAMVAGAPRFEEIAREVWEAVDGRVLVAHNARFDYGFLKNEFKRLGKTFGAPVLCTVKLSRKLFPQHARHNLDSLMARHGINCEARHRALGDARVLWQLAQQWREDPGEAAVLEATAKLLKTATVPAGLPDNAFEHIPEGPGVYLFYGERDVPLYVGKSISLRTRVMSHFSGDHRVAKDMRIAAEVKRIDWIETAGELGALIEEARLVKKLSPVHNRQLRRAGELCAWHWPAQAAAIPPQLVSARDLAGGEFRDLYGLFRSRRAAIEALRDCWVSRNATAPASPGRSSAAAAPAPASKPPNRMRCGWPPRWRSCACAPGLSPAASASARPPPAENAASCMSSTSGAISAPCATTRSCANCRKGRRGRCSTSTPTRS